ncbi:MAG: GNAT family N-acetyltransferase [Phycisphaerales bacterium]|nr:MAG: GNAT family N-acetyltransferase [Phycisphaerales bacterium]
MIDGPYHLARFRAEHGQAVASWVVSRSELLMVAPLTSPPLTGDKVRAWTYGPERGYVYVDGDGEPVAYGELNPMPNRPRALWVGHFMVAPHARSRNVGRRFLRALLTEGFERRRAESVGLVVFPTNEAAIRCYRSVGFVDAGPQYRRFPGSWRRHELRFMQIFRAEYERRPRSRRPEVSVAGYEPTYTR